jgi:predicted RNA-binding Zn-ribbon protein involved in translation (DUF1610 family)
MEEEKALNCTSCNTSIQVSGNFVKFKCPSCGEKLIVRCEACRSENVSYKCKCGFVGP